MKPSASPDEAKQNNLGRIEGLAVPLILASIHQTGTTGVLHFTKGNIKKSLYIKEGDIVFATSSDHQDRLGEILIKQGKCTERDLENAVSRLGGGRRLGAILTEDEKMTPEDLVENVMEQVRQIVFSIFEWDKGFYQYEEGKLPSLELITLTQSTPELLFQGIREMSDMKILLRSLGGLKRKFVLDPSHREKMQQCLHSDEERKVAELLEAPSSAEEILKATSLNTMDVIRTLVAMKITGLAKEEVNPIARSFEKESDIKGDLAEEDLLNVLGLLTQRGVEGTLFIRSEPIEAGCFVKNGELISLYLPEETISFLNILSEKTSNLPDTPAEESSSLERVSERKAQTANESAEKSPKGAKEDFGLKVLDEIMKLPEGEYVFLQGEPLPTPEIQINTPVVSLIQHFIEKIDDWARIEKGCGEPETWLILTPSYLEAVDHISINDQLWDIISKLKAPCSVSEMISSFPMAKEELCRWLWYFQAAGAIKRFDDEDVKEQAEEFADLPELEKFQEEDNGEGEAIQEKKAEHSEETAQDTSSTAETTAGTAFQEDIPKDLGEKDAADPLDEEWRELVQQKEIEKSVKEDKKAPVLVESEKDKEARSSEETMPDAEKPAEKAKDEENTREKQQDTDQEEKILDDIKKFNEKQKYIFEKLKSEMGAGTQNFIHYCQNRMGEENNPFSDIPFGMSGDWDVSALADQIVQKGIENHLMAFDRILEIEIDMVGNFLSPKKKKELGKGIREIEKRQMKIE
jgi:hypothetical protein